MHKEQHVVFQDGQVAYIGGDLDAADKAFTAKSGNVRILTASAERIVKAQEAIRSGQSVNGSQVYREIDLDAVLKASTDQLAAVLTDLGITPEKAQKALETMSATAEKLVNDIHDTGTRGLRIVGAAFKIVGESLSKIE